MLRRAFGSGLRLGLVAGVALGAWTVAAVPASAQGGEGLARQFHAELNAERAARGLRPLDHDSGVAVASTSWAERLQAKGSLGHSGSGRAEIVGTGSRSGQITDAWMRSPGHRKIVVDPNMAAVGVGVRCDRAGRIWVVAQFRQRDPRRGVPAAGPSPRATSPSSGATCADDAEPTVRRLYAAFFDREADSTGMATYSARAAAGEPVSAIGAMLAASPEFAARYGSLDDRHFVTGAYRHLLRREPDPQGFDHWLRVLRAHGRGAVLAGFAESAEFRALTGL